MEEVVNFIDNISNKRHLLSLLPKERWQLHIRIGSMKIGVSLSSNVVEINHIDQSNGILTCSEEDWQSIITGECKLRQCIRLGNTDYKGNFRSLLMLESIFFLQVPV